MSRPPRAVDRPILTGFGIWRVIFVGLALLAFTLWAFFWMKGQGASDALARTVAVNAITIGQCFFLLNSRYLIDSSLSIRAHLGNKYVPLGIGAVIVLQLLFTYAPPLQAAVRQRGRPAVRVAVADRRWLRVLPRGRGGEVRHPFERFLEERRDGGGGGHLNLNHSQSTTLHNALRRQSPSLRDRTPDRPSQTGVHVAVPADDTGYAGRAGRSHRPREPGEDRARSVACRRERQARPVADRGRDRRSRRRRRVLALPGAQPRGPRHARERVARFGFQTLCGRWSKCPTAST